MRRLFALAALCVATLAAQQKLGINISAPGGGAANLPGVTSDGNNGLSVAGNLKIATTSPSRIWLTAGTAPTNTSDGTASHDAVLYIDSADNHLKVRLTDGTVIDLSTGAATSTAATPTFSPAAGSYTGTQSVTLSTTTASATICYTTDGSTPAATTPGTCSTGSTYSGAISVASSLTVKAIATKSGMTNSSVASAAYTITTGVADPTFSPAAGTYTGTQSVTISTTTASATICYTTDGSTPAASTPGTCSAGTTYSGAVSVASSLTIKAIATKSGLANSAVVSAAYTINSSGGTTYTDNFGGSALDGNWTINKGGFAESTAQVFPSVAATVNVASYTAGAFSADQWAQATIGNLSSAEFGPTVRIQAGSTDTGYAVSCSGNNLHVTVLKSGYPALGSNSTCAANDVIRIEATGSSIQVKKNGSVVIGPVTDTTYASGTPGIWGYAAGGTPSVSTVTTGKAWSAGSN